MIERAERTRSCYLLRLAAIDPIRPAAHDFARHQSFQVHVEGRGLDWATEVFSTSTIHQGSTSRLLGPFQLSNPSKQVLSWLKLPATHSRAAHTMIKR